MKIEVKGLAEFSRGLRRLDQEAPKGLRIALNGAADLLISETVRVIPKRTGAAARSLKARSTRTSARVAIGGKRAPYYPWLDFGGRTGRRRSVQRPFIKEGRYLFPTLVRVSPKIADHLDEALTEVARKSGLVVD